MRILDQRAQERKDDEIGESQRPAGEREVELAGVKRELFTVKVKQDKFKKAAGYNAKK